MAPLIPCTMASVCSLGLSPISLLFSMCLIAAGFFVEILVHPDALADGHHNLSQAQCSSFGRSTAAIPTAIAGLALLACGMIALSLSPMSRKGGLVVKATDISRLSVTAGLSLRERHYGSAQAECDCSQIRHCYACFRSAKAPEVRFVHSQDSLYRIIVHRRHCVVRAHSPPNRLASRSLPYTGRPSLRYNVHSLPSRLVR